MTKSLSGRFISSSDSKWHDKATHVVVPTNYNGYTAKIFYGLGSEHVHIVTQAWLDDSAKEGELLSPSKYEPGYVKKALENATRAAQNGGILGGYG